MSPEEKSRLEELDRLLQSQDVREEISRVATRQRSALAQKQKAVMTWEPIPLEIFGRTLPAGIRSGWVFVLRAGADTGPERHPNSHQRMMSMEGTGDMRVEEQGEWRSHFLSSKPNAPFSARWISIPPNVWHRPVVGNDCDWIVVSFHTVAAEDLIEERPGQDAADETKQMRYLAT